MTNPNLPAQGPGRSFKGTFGLTEVKVFVPPGSDASMKIELKLAPAVADFSQPEAKLEPNFDDRTGRDRRVGPASWASDGDELTAWGIDAGPGLRNRDRAIVIPLAEAASLEVPSIITVELVQNHGGWNSDDHQNNLLGCFRLSVTDAMAPASATPLLAMAMGSRADSRALASVGWATSLTRSSAAAPRVRSAVPHAVRMSARR